MQKEKIDQIIDNLSDQGWTVIPQIFNDDLLDQLIKEEHDYWSQGTFIKARIGTGDQKELKPEIRSDRVLWLKPDDLSPAQQEYWNHIDELRVALNQELYVGAQYFEAHFAVYPPGSFYKKHLDQFKQHKTRLISCILYLNRDWEASDGGSLRIYQGENDDLFIDVLPEFGTFVCFRSALVYHEVLPSKRERYSLTGWLRRD